VTLIDDLWGLDVPADATNALQSVVSRTRRRLPPGALDSTPAGYVLRCAAVDADEFEQLVTAGRADEALALWRGDPLVDVDDFPFAAAEAGRLIELRLTAIEASHARRAFPELPFPLLTTEVNHRSGWQWRIYSKFS
jgi:hypothetical protein